MEPFCALPGSTTTLIGRTGFIIHVMKYYSSCSNLFSFVGLYTPQTYSEFSRPDANFFALHLPLLKNVNFHILSVSIYELLTPIIV